VNLTSGARAPARPPSLRVYEYMLLRYRRTWRGTLTSSFLEPLFFLLAMGLGLGHLVNSHLSHVGSRAALGGVGYVTFIAPGVLAATAMQMASNESTYPIMEGAKWLKTYFAMLASPVGVGDIQLAQLLWAATRLTFASSVFLAVVAAFGAVLSPLAVLALPAAVLTGMAFASPITAFSITQENDSSFPIMYRLGIIPLFLFSGTFFPITNLPGWLQAVARVTPLYHGVALCRAFVLGRVDWIDALAHIAYLVALLAVGLAVGRRTFARRLVQ
jgi:lipooligosaccharide transport system permease protein